VSNLISSPS